MRIRIPRIHIHTTTTSTHTGIFTLNRSLRTGLLQSSRPFQPTVNPRYRFFTTLHPQHRPTILHPNPNLNPYYATMSTPNPDLVESAKKAAARTAVAQHFNPKTMRYIGIGSGTTIKYVIDAIKDALAATPPPEQLHFIPTGTQSKNDIIAAGLMAVSLDHIPDEIVLDVAFDGADEVDEEFNCVKGGGLCLFQEKLVATRAKEFVAVADFRKDSKRLLTAWSYIPIEVAPIAVTAVLKALRRLGCPSPSLRSHQNAKEGPLKTDQGFYLIMAPFPPLLTAKDVKNGKISGKNVGQTIDKADATIWDVDTLAKEIKSIPGVLDVGLFFGENGAMAAAHGYVGGQKPVSVYFGMQDGSIKIRRAPRKLGEFASDTGSEETLAQE